MAPKTVENHVRNIFTKLQLLPASEDHRQVLAVLAFFAAQRTKRVKGPCAC
jgi:DNA-binding NarL/FixJ family response regulator